MQPWVPERPQFGGQSTDAAFALDEAITDANIGDELSKNLRDAADARTSEHMTVSTTNSKKGSGAPPRDQTLKATYKYFTLRDYHVLDFRT